MHACSESDHYNERYWQIFQVLLVFDTLIGGDEGIESMSRCQP